MPDPRPRQLLGLIGQAAGVSVCEIPPVAAIGAGHASWVFVSATIDAAA
jgi:hypothetical protein